MSTDEATTHRVAEAGWQQMGDTGGTPFWQWQEDSTVRVLTGNQMILSFAGAALNLREEMTYDEEAQFVGAHLTGGSRGDIFDAGWQRLGRTRGAPLWEWRKDNSVCFVTCDHEVLRMVGAVLNLREEMTDSEQAQFLGRYLLGGRSGMPSDEHPPPAEDTGPGQYIAAS